MPDSPNPTIRLALLVEATLNIVGATTLLLYPAPILSQLTTSAHFVNPLSITLSRYISALFYGLTPQLVLAIPNTRRCVESRWMIYVTLLAGEGALMAAMVADWMVGGGVSGNAVVGCLAGLAPFVAWRVWVLGFRDGGVGRVEDERKGL